MNSQLSLLNPDNNKLNKMFAIALAFLCLALVRCQETTHATHTKHPHTHHPHSHSPHTYPTHTHPSHRPIPDHKFDSANPEFFLDSYHALVMKTKSGCYGLHLDAEHAKQAQTAGGIIELERSLLNQVTHATFFTTFHEQNLLNADIQAACPRVYRPHHPHPSPHPTH